MNTVFEYLRGYMKNLMIERINYTKDENYHKFHFRFIYSSHSVGIETGLWDTFHDDQERALFVFKMLLNDIYKEMSK